MFTSQYREYGWLRTNKTPDRPVDPWRVVNPRKACSCGFIVPAVSTIQRITGRRGRPAFSALHGRMSGCLDGFYLAIEYVGSTSIPSLAGKDKVDVDVIMASKLIRIHRAPRCSRDACTHRLTHRCPHCTLILNTSPTPPRPPNDVVP
jgi:hypothetical protein